jgi:hypothetical protein
MPTAPGLPPVQSKVHRYRQATIGGCQLIIYRVKALNPVMARPTIKVLISRVPS